MDSLHRLILQRLSDVTVPIKSAPRASAALDRDVIDRYRSGQPELQIWAETGMPPIHVRILAMGEGIPPREDVPSSEKEESPEVRRLLDAGLAPHEIYDTGVRPSEIARTLGVLTVQIVVDDLIRPHTTIRPGDDDVPLNGLPPLATGRLSPIAAEIVQVLDADDRFQSHMCPVTVGAAELQRAQDAHGCSFPDELMEYYSTVGWGQLAHLHVSDPEKAWAGAVWWQFIDDELEQFFSDAEHPPPGESWGDLPDNSAVVFASTSQGELFYDTAGERPGRITYMEFGFVDDGPWAVTAAPSLRAFFECLSELAPEGLFWKPDGGGRSAFVSYLRDDADIESVRHILDRHGCSAGVLGVRGPRRVEG